MQRFVALIILLSFLFPATGASAAGAAVRVAKACDIRMDVCDLSGHSASGHKDCSHGHAAVTTAAREKAAHEGAHAEHATSRHDKGKENVPYFKCGCGHDAAGKYAPAGSDPYVTDKKEVLVLLTGDEVNPWAGPSYKSPVHSVPFKPPAVSWFIHL